MTPTEALKIAALLEQDDVFEFVAGAIGASRDKAPRVPVDRDSTDVLFDVIDALRAVPA